MSIKKGPIAPFYSSSRIFENYDKSLIVETLVVPISECGRAGQEGVVANALRPSRVPSLRKKP